MATEDILIRYRADVSQLEADINKVIASQEELTAATKQNTTEQSKAANSAEFAAKKRAQLLELEVQKLKQLQQAQKLAFDPKEIEKYNREISESTRRIEQLEGRTRQVGNNTDEVFNRITNTAQRVAGALGIAFSLEAVVAFGQQAVNAFLEAEKSVKRLEGAIVGFGGESIESFEALNNQAELLGATSLESADSIRKAQITLSNFGLNASQISQILPGLIGQAKRTGESLDSFASKVGSALQGTGKQFQLLGANIDSNKTQLENYNELLRALSDEAQNATLSTDELTDSIALQQKQVEDLTTQIGGELAPGWIAAKKAALEYIASVLNIPTVGKQVAAQALPSIQAETQARIEQLRAEGKETSDIIGFLRGDLDRAKAEAEKAGQNFKNVQDEFGGVLATLTKLTDNNFRLIAKVRVEGASVAKEVADANVSALQQQIDSLNSERELKEKTLGLDKLRVLNSKQLQDELIKNQQQNDLASRTNVTNIEKEIEARKRAGEASKRASEEAKRQAEEFRKFILSIDTEIAKLQSDLERRKIEVIPADSQKAQEDRIKALADLNEKAISDEIAAKVKLVQDDGKLSEKQKQEAIAKYEELKQARLNLAQFNEQNELNIISEQQLKKIEEAKKKVSDLNLEQELVVQADVVETANEQVAKSFEDLGKAISKSDLEAAKGVATARTEALNQAITEEAKLQKQQIENARTTAKAQVKEGDAKEAQLLAIKTEYDNKIANVDKATADKIAENNAELNNQITNNTERATKDRIAQTFEILNATQQLIGELSSLYAQFSEQRIGEIEAERDAQLESIEAQLTQNEEYLEQRRISEEEAAAQEKALIAEREKIEAAAQKKIREEKRKQAVLDKANALFQIALNTAVALTGPDKITNPFLIALVLATSALQAAAVAAQPIPYRKGSKDTGAKGHMARVGEEGEEIVYMPGGSKVLPAKQTRRYGEVIDAMFDNRLDDYIYKNYITPALVAQNEKKEGARAKNFADNIARSISYNQPGLTASDLEAQRKRGQYIRNVDELADAIAKKIPTRDIYRA